MQLSITQNLNEPIGSTLQFRNQHLRLIHGHSAIQCPLSVVSLTSVRPTVRSFIRSRGKSAAHRTKTDIPKPICVNVPFRLHDRPLTANAGYNCYRNAVRPACITCFILRCTRPVYSFVSPFVSPTVPGINAIYCWYNNSGLFCPLTSSEVLSE